MSEQRVQILLVEDEENHAELVRRAFEPRSGKFSLAVAMNLKKAKEYLAKSTPDLVIADLHLPDGSGAELLAAKEERSQFPVVIMTSYGDEQAAVEAMKRGALDYVVKSELTFAHMPHIAERALREWALIIDHNQTEKTLRESEEKYRNLFNNAQVGIFRTRISDGKVLECNDRFARTYGYETPDECKDDFVVSEHYADPDIREKMVASLMEKGEVNDIEGCFSRKDGDDVWVRFSARAYPEEGYLEGVGYDITEEKRALEALRESEENFRVLYDNSPDMYVSVSPDDASILLCNETLLNKTNYSREEIIGSPIFKMYHDDCIAGAKKAFQQLVETGVIRDKKLILKRKDGSKIDVSLNVNAVRDETGEIQYSISTWRDITEAKLAEEALQESEIKFRSLFDFSPQAIALTDVETGRVFDVNDMFCKLTKYSKKEILGFTTIELEFYSEKDRNRLMKELKVSGKVHGLEMNFKIKDGSIINTLMFATVIQIGGESFILTIFVNMSDQKRLEAQLQQAQKMEAMGTLAGGIAHDFNNLLMAIQGRTSIMLTKKDSSHPDIRHLKGIEDNVESAADLTRQLLGFARGGKYEVKPTDLNELIKKQNRMFGRTKKEIAIRGKYEKDLWSVEVDQGQIDQVLLNLYVNAWQAMPAGGDLYLETENVTLDENYVKPFSIEPGKYVKISVTDTGTGMDKATQEKIFEPFFTTKEMGRGTGLGLASSYGIVKNHGGFINVYSEKGHGTTFNVYLPASEKEVVAQKKSDGDLLRGSETILFVDDEDMIIEVAEEMFEQLGYKLLIARSGKEAIETYEKNKELIDIVLLDMIMPDMSGSDTYDKMKEIDPDIKVLLSSGYSINGQATEIMERGCNGFIQKPFKMQELSQKLREILDEK